MASTTTWFATRHAQGRLADLWGKLKQGKTPGAAW
jgi:hypothetical protein